MLQKESSLKESKAEQKKKDPKNSPVLDQSGGVPSANTLTQENPHKALQSQPLQVWRKEETVRLSTEELLSTRHICTVCGADTKVITFQS